MSDNDYPVGPPSAVILAVEDDLNVGTTVVDILEYSGYRAKLIESGDKALEYLRGGGEASVVFSDVHMAGQINGLRLAEIIKEEFPTTPVILTTGYVEEEHAARRVGIPMLPKPYRIAELLGAIAMALGSIVY